MFRACASVPAARPCPLSAREQRHRSVVVPQYSPLAQGALSVRWVKSLRGLEHTARLSGVYSPRIFRILNIAAAVGDNLQAGSSSLPIDLPLRNEGWNNLIIWWAWWGWLAPLAFLMYLFYFNFAKEASALAPWNRICFNSVAVIIISYNTLVSLLVCRWL